MACTNPTARGLWRHDGHSNQPQHLGDIHHPGDTTLRTENASSVLMMPGLPSRRPRANLGWPQNKLKKIHGHEQNVNTLNNKQLEPSQAKAAPPPAPFSVKAPPVAPPVTPSINPPRQPRVEQSPVHRAFETLRQTAGSTVHSIPASVHTPPPVPNQTELIRLQGLATTNPMTQSWSVISGFPEAPSPPRIPDTILGAWSTQFTRQLPPIHISGMPSSTRTAACN